MQKIGWIGIGKMGKPMSRRLMNAGYELYVCDNVPSAADEAVKAGATFVETPAALMNQVDIFFSMIPNAKILKDIVFGKNGVLETIRPGAIYIDMSTIDPDTSAEVGEAIDKAGAYFIRSCVSGSVEFAEKGTLSGMSSGDETAYEKILPLLKILTRSQTHLGKKEEARHMKIIVNMMLATCVQAMAESLVMGEAVGMDWEKMVEILADSAAACPAVKFKLEQYKQRDFRPMSTAAIMNKDMGIAMNIAKQYKLAMPVAAMTQQLYLSMENTGKGDLDYSAVLLVNEELNGIKFPEK